SARSRVPTTRPSDGTRTPAWRNPMAPQRALLPRVYAPTEVSPPGRQRRPSAATGLRRGHRLRSSPHCPPPTATLRCMPFGIGIWELLILLLVLLLVFG